MNASVESEALCGAGSEWKRVRFMFARDNPDLVMYMLKLRAELHMRMVMPTVVRHSAAEPFMPMARFETGPGGNHWHLFAKFTALHVHLAVLEMPVSYTHLTLPTKA